MKEPETLGEYRDACVAISPYGEKCKAVTFLDERIAKEGRDERVIQHSSQMLMLLDPMMMEEVV